MTGATRPAGLERRYRRLLRWYPRSFRAEQGEEMLAVLMAGAADGQRRPRPKESANVITSALGMRWQAATSRVPDPGWADGLAMFSLAAPLFLLVIDVLEVVLPYRLPENVFSRPFGAAQQIGGLSLLSQRGFDFAAGGQVIIAVLVLLGLRRLALAAIAAAAVYWIVTQYWIPEPLQLFSTGVYLLGGVALIASPDLKGLKGLRGGRHLMRWGHGVALLLIAVAVQISTIRYDMLAGPGRFLLGPGRADTAPYTAASVALAVIAAGLMVVFKLNRYLLLLLAALLYPYVMQLAFSPGASGSDLIGSPTPVHLAVLYLPLLLLAGAAALVAVRLRAGGQPASA